ncbi:MAG: hypothetical protein GQ549_00985 [Gammaproteobacteria bacterium]|nr:hypothetical protein [Gammaproteobacteria bacterium]
MIAELGLVFAGLLISTAAMTIGIGGGILWTPLLILAYGLSPQEMKLFNYFNQHRERKNLDNCSCIVLLPSIHGHIILCYATKSAHVPLLILFWR